MTFDFQTPVPQLIVILIAVVFVVLVYNWPSTRTGSRFKLKSPLLGFAEQDLYRRLVRALPDHIILAQVAFSRLIQVAGDAAEQKVADFVVCERSFDVVAVIELDDSTRAPDKDERRDGIAREAGVKTIRWDVSRLPRPDEIRRLVLGE